MRITNCHIHIFTIDHTPDNFVPMMGRLFRYRLFRKNFRFLLKSMIPFTDRDLLDRFSHFLKISHRGSQEKIVETVMGYYPKETRFIVLPMDMEYMEAGTVKASLEIQHDELAQLASKSHGRIIPFVAVDPNRPDILKTVKGLVENRGYQGIKIYPALGYYPTDERLYPVYEYAEKKGIPVMSHCLRNGSVYSRKKITDDMLTHPITGKPLEKLKPKEFANYYTDPDNYAKVLSDFPGLRLCLAHFGGSKEWEHYLYKPWDEHRSEEKSWLAKIMDMIKSEKYPNLYTDISYTVLEDEHYFHALKVFMSDGKIRNRILFGSDFYMVELEKMEERKLSIKLRSVLGEEFFALIADTNPSKYLGEIES
ncbi:MAG: amidohydrolase family protein [Planctomycetota bacterium]